jgi:hypothetical protein
MAKERKGSFYFTVKDSPRSLLAKTFDIVKMAKAVWVIWNKRPPMPERKAANLIEMDEI